MASGVSFWPTGSSLGCLLRASSLPLSRPRPRPRLRLCSHLLRPRTASALTDSDIAAIRADLAARPPSIVYDVLSPMPSHLLNVCLSDGVQEAAEEVGSRSHPAVDILLRHSSVSFSASPSKRTLPPGHHFVYFPLQKPASQLMSDGTDPGQAPGGAFVRRMWAGGSVEWRPGADKAGTDAEAEAETAHSTGPAEDATDLLLDGRPAVCVERLGDVQMRGRPGEEKVYVDVWRRYGGCKDGSIVQDGGDGCRKSSSASLTAAWAAAVEASPAVRERRSLVFLRVDAAAPAVRNIKAPHPPDYAFSLVPSARLLFQFSALTFNAHAIHLDAAYCRDVEGHPGLLVHGPLVLVLMLSGLRRAAAASSEHLVIKRIDYRNLAPLYADQPLRVCVRRLGPGPGHLHDRNSSGSESRWEVWVENAQGGLAVRATAVTAALV